MDTKALNEIISKSGISITFIANQLGISRQQLYKKLNGETEFKVSEANAIFRVLRLTKKEKEKIFFGNKSD